jgi:hypothetical protein
MTNAGAVFRPRSSVALNVAEQLDGDESLSSQLTA